LESRNGIFEIRVLLVSLKKGVELRGRDFRTSKWTVVAAAVAAVVVHGFVGVC
jgi:hypothetical protein